MPVYQFKNKVTGDIEEIVMTISEYSSAKQDANFTSQWERYFTPASTPATISQSGETCDRAMKSCPQFRDAIDRIKRNIPYNQIDAQLGGSVKKYDDSVTSLRKMVEKAKTR